MRRIPYRAEGCDSYCGCRESGLFGNIEMVAPLTIQHLPRVFCIDGDAFLRRVNNRGTLPSREAGGDREGTGDCGFDEL